MSKSNLIPLPSDLDLTTPEGIVILNDRLRRLQQASGTGNTVVKAATHVVGGGTTPPGGPGPGGTAPADVTILSLTPVYRSLPDAYGNILLDALAEYTVPMGWTGDGVHKYDEFPDQSAGLVMQLVSAVITGTPAPGIGDAILAGEWALSDDGKTPYDATAAHHYALFTDLVAPVKPADLRIYLVGYNAGSDPKPVRAGFTGASPTAVVTVQSPLVLGGAPPIPDLTNFTAVAGAPYDRGDGKLIQPVITTFDPPTSDQIAGVWFEAISDDPLAPPERHSVPVISLASGQFTFRMDATVALHNVVIYARTFDSSGNINPISSLTPRAIISIGSLTGTIDATRLMLSKLAAYFVIQANLFGIANQGITNQLIADLTVTAQQLAAAAVTAPKVASLAIGTANIQAAAITTALIQNAAITNALIANLAVDDAKIASLVATKLLAGTIIGSTLSLTSSGVTTTIDNTAQVGVTAGLRTSQTISAHVYMTQTAPVGTYCYYDNLLRIALNVVSGNGVVTVGDNGGNTGQLQATSLSFNATQVVTSRQAGPGNTTDSTDVATRFNSLLAILRTHGLIT